MTNAAEWPGLVVLMLAAFVLGLGPAITVVYAAHLVPMVFAVVFMFRLVRIRGAADEDQPASRSRRSRSSAPKHSRFTAAPPSRRRVSTWPTIYSGRPVSRYRNRSRMQVLLR